MMTGIDLECLGNFVQELQSINSNLMQTIEELNNLKTLIDDERFETLSTLLANEDLLRLNEKIYNTDKKIEKLAELNKDNYIHNVYVDILCENFDERCMPHTIIERAKEPVYYSSNPYPQYYSSNPYRQYITDNFYANE